MTTLSSLLQPNHATCRIHLFRNLALDLTAMSLSPYDIRRTLLTYLGNGATSRSHADNFSVEAADAELKEHYGLGSTALAVLWQDSCDISGELRLEESEKTLRGFIDLKHEIVVGRLLLSSFDCLGHRALLDCDWNRKHTP